MAQLVIDRSDAGLKIHSEDKERKLALSLRKPDPAGSVKLMSPRDVLSPAGFESVVCPMNLTIVSTNR